jgi:hypothetical protein
VKVTLMSLPEREPRWRGSGVSVSEVSVECFCGCGRAIPRFPLGTRAMNKRGRLVREQLAWAQAVAGDLEQYAEWYEEGDEIVATLAAAMHGEVDPRSVNEEWVGHWQEYGRHLQVAAAMHGMPSINDWLRRQSD